MNDSYLTESFVTKKCLVAGNSEDRGYPIGLGEDGTDSVGVAILNLHFHSHDDVVPTVRHGSLWKQGCFKDGWVQEWARLKK
jgi:hypothetical protein